MQKYSKYTSTKKSIISSSIQRFNCTDFPLYWDVPRKNNDINPQYRFLDDAKFSARVVNHATSLLSPRFRREKVMFLFWRHRHRKWIVSNGRGRLDHCPAQRAFGNFVAFLPNIPISPQTEAIQSRATQLRPPRKCSAWEINLASIVARYIKPSWRRQPRRNSRILGNEVQNHYT